MMIAFNNLIFFTVDAFAFWGDPNYEGMKPSMYDNWFSRLFLANPWGLFAWYDVFSVQGYFNWVADSYVVGFFPWVSLIQGFIRQGRNDWTYLTWESGNPIDKNRLF